MMSLLLTSLIKNKNYGGGWVNRWVDGRAVLRIAYSNQKMNCDCKGRL